MWSFLDKIRRQPKERREQFAFAAAFGITLVIGLGWLAALTLTTDDSSMASTRTNGQESSSVFGEFATDASDRFTSVISQIRSTLSSPEPTSPTTTNTTNLMPETAPSTRSTTSRSARVIQIVTTSPATTSATTTE